MSWSGHVNCLLNDAFQSDDFGNSVLCLAIA